MFLGNNKIGKKRSGLATSNVSRIRSPRRKTPVVHKLINPCWAGIVGAISESRQSPIAKKSGIGNPSCLSIRVVKHNSTSFKASR